MVLLGGDVGLGGGLLQTGLRLLESGVLLLQLLLGAAGVEADHGIAFFDCAAGRRLPYDAQRGDVDRRGDLDRAARLELTAAAHDHGEIALARGGHGQRSGSLYLAQPVDARAGCYQHYDTDRQPGLHRPPPLTLAAPSRTTAAERSGNKCGSLFSSRKRAVKVLMGLPSAEEATGLPETKCASKASSG